MVLNVDKNVLRTPAVIVDALLGQGEALDCFTQNLEKEATKKSQLDNKKTELILQTLEAITDPTARAEAMAKIFNPPATVINESPTTN